MSDFFSTLLTYDIKTPLEGQIHVLLSEENILNAVAMQGVETRWISGFFDAKIQENRFNQERESSGLGVWNLSGYFNKHTLIYNGNMVAFPNVDAINPPFPYSWIFAIHATLDPEADKILDVLPPPPALQSVWFAYQDDFLVGVGAFPWLRADPVGLLYAAADESNPEAFWAWDAGLERWLWVKPTDYPWFYDVANDDWITFLRVFRNEDQELVREFWSDQAEAAFVAPYVSPFGEIP